MSGSRLGLRSDQRSKVVESSARRMATNGNFSGGCQIEVFDASDYQQMLTNVNIAGRGRWQEMARFGRYLGGHERGNETGSGIASPAKSKQEARQRPRPFVRIAAPADNRPVPGIAQREAFRPRADMVPARGALAFHGIAAVGAGRAGGGRQNRAGHWCAVNFVMP